MSHVRGHYRSNGSYVRPHTRRTRKSTTTRVTQQTSTGYSTHVRGHYRSNGSYVRPHTRRLNTPATVVVGGGGLFILFALLLLLGSCGGAGSAASTSSHPVSDVTSHGGTVS